MSVLIKGMEMPTSCMDCPFKGFDRAGGRGNICTIDDSITLHAVLDGVDVKFVRMGDCPLVPVPPHHGRLIDADAMGMNYLHIRMDDGMKIYTQRAIDNAPTIIPADESNMDSFIRIFEEDDEEDGMDSFIRILKD